MKINLNLFKLERCPFRLNLNLKLILIVLKISNNFNLIQIHLNLNTFCYRTFVNGSKSSFDRHVDRQITDSRSSG